MAYMGDIHSRKIWTPESANTDLTAEHENEKNAVGKSSGEATTATLRNENIHHFMFSSRK